MLKNDKIDLIKKTYYEFAFGDEFYIPAELGVSFLNEIINLGASLVGIDLFKILDSANIKYECTQEYSKYAYNSYIEASMLLSGSGFDLASVNFDIFDDYTTEEKFQKLRNLFKFESDDSIILSKTERARFLNLCFNLRLYINDKNFISENRGTIDLKFAERFAHIEEKISRSEDTHTFFIDRG